ncbi:MAG: hypothetical protein HY870_04685 [Chloroflexi bacterium]|nr:hypothetical protein [Chloroflexota bacterium]
MLYAVIPIVLFSLSFLAGMMGLTSVTAVVGAWLGAKFMAKRVKSLTLSHIFAAALVLSAIQRVVILLTA